MSKKVKIFSNGKEIFYRKKNSIILPKEIFKFNQTLTFNNKLLHPEDKLARKPIVSWVKEINIFLSNINSKEVLVGQIENISIAYNHATYLMAVIGDFKNAYKFCYIAISFFNDVFNYLNKAECLFYSIQPWINLIRLDRILTKEDNALNKLQFLVQSYSKPATDHENIISKIFNLNPPQSLLEIINNAYIIETLKIFLNNKNYKCISDLKNNPNINSFHLSLIAESEIIAFNNIKEFDKSFYIASNQYTNGLPIAMPVFLYRIIELVPISESKKYLLIDTMINYIQRKLKTNNYSLYDLVFMYEVYKYIFFEAEKFRDIELILLFANAFLQVNDEPGRIDSLRLASLLDKRYLKCWNNLTQSTNYYFINPKSMDVVTNSSDYKLMLENLESFQRDFFK